jgi:hypothetical protein
MLVAKDGLVFRTYVVQIVELKRNSVSRAPHQLHHILAIPNIVESMLEMGTQDLDSNVVISHLGSFLGRTNAFGDKTLGAGGWKGILPNLPYNNVSDLLGLLIHK